MCSTRITLIMINFNPRSREGSDNIVVKIDEIQKISIHAPARGATKYSYAKTVAQAISIHAPARGATRFLYFNISSAEISIHAPARGATNLILESPTSSPISIHAPARGATAVDAVPLVDTQFQSTLPRGERRNQNRQIPA